MLDFAGYVSICVQLYCVGFHCLSLNVSAYMAIFTCVGYFIFVCLKDSASLLFSAKQTQTQRNKKNNEGKQHKKNGNVQSVTT
jgi:hypothetical protein